MLSYFPKETKQKKESSLSVILECHTLRTLLPSIKHAIFICTVAQILVSIPPDSCSDKKLKPPQQKKKNFSSSRPAMFIDRFRVHRRFTLPLGCDVLESSRGKEGGG